MKIERVRIDGLRPYARNPRRHSDRQVALIARSIQEYGWTVPILVDADGAIVAGHGRYEAARLLGLNEVPVIRLADLSPEAIRRYRIADNRIAELSEWDDEMLLAELESIVGAEPETLGYSAEELAAILGVAETQEEPEAPLERGGGGEAGPSGREAPATVVLEFPPGTWPLIRDEAIRVIEKAIGRWGGRVR